MDSATVTLTANDEKMGLNTSQVAATYYKINNGAFTQYSAPFTVTTQGENTVQYYSVDLAGNAEAVKSIVVKVDKDTDADTLYDNFDSCDSSKGTIAYQGCPVGDSNEVIMHLIDQAKSGECGCKGTVQFKTKEFRYGKGCTTAQLEKYPGRDSRDYFECTDALGYTTITVHSATIAQSGIKTNKVKVNGRDISNFVYQGKDSAGLNVWQTRVPILAAKDRLQVYFKTFKTSTGAECKPASTCQEPLDQVEIRVFDRSTPAFVAAWTQDPKATNYPAIFDTATSIATCTTDDTGTCIAGETAVGKYLVIAKYSDDDLNKTVYVGRTKEPDDFKDTNKDGIKDLAYKDFQVTKTIKKTGEIEYTASGKIQVVGSMLEIIKPDYTLWTNTQELYPFIFTSDSGWSVDVCVFMPEGYQIKEVMDEEGNLISSTNCTQAFVENETKTIIFTLLETGSPEPNMNANLSLVNPHGVASVVSLEIPGQRVKPPFDMMLAALLIGAVVIVAIVVSLIMMKGEKKKK
jgi:PKD repeat protein